MIRDVHSAIQDFKKLQDLALELELEFPELGISKVIDDLNSKFYVMIVETHRVQEENRIKDDLSVITK